MKKEELESELLKVLSDANTLQERSEVELKTAEFLKGQADELLKRFEDPATPIDEKEQLQKEMETLHVRISYEITQFEKNVGRMKILENKLNALRLEAEAYLQKE
jgi:hypothetical protein